MWFFRTNRSKLKSGRMGKSMVTWFFILCFVKHWQAKFEQYMAEGVSHFEQFMWEFGGSLGSYKGSSTS